MQDVGGQDKRGPEQSGKMAATAILDFANRFLGPPTMANDGLKCPLKFRVDLIYAVEDTAM